MRVAFGVTCSPFVLNGTIKNHVEIYRFTDEELVERLKEDFYVDDLVPGSDNVAIAKIFVERVSNIMSEAGFELRKWVTNSPSLKQFLELMNGDFPKMTSGCIDLKEEKQVLGLDWNVSDDEFVYNFDKFLTKCDGMKLTKRNILSVASSFYDHLGCISPVTARTKVIFQLLCKNKLDWDDEVSDDLKLTWFELLRTLRDLKTVKLKRCAFSDAAPSHVEFHGFCDSSFEVYCAVAYLRIVSDEGIAVNVLCAKTKSLTIPRLELLSYLLLSTLFSECKLALKRKIKIDKTFCSSDSKVALC